MNIAIITSGILPVPAVQGGAVENLIDYVLEYNDQHHLHQITVYSVYNKKTKNHPAIHSSVNHYEYINTGTTFFRYYSKLRIYFCRDLYYHHRLEYFLACVWKKMKKQQFDLIILQNRPGFAISLSKWTRTPIISHIHTNLLSEPSPINQRMVSATSRFFAVSKYIKQEILKVGINTDIRVVYNGLDTTKFNIGKGHTVRRADWGLGEKDFVAVFWGRLVPKKGIKELLQAISLLQEQQDIKLLVIGSINYEDTNNQTNVFIEELKSIADSMPGKVIFTGYVPYDKIPDYIALGNVAVIPSLINEALGMTCIEACAMGLPVIATNDGGISETLTGQKHILLEKGDNLPARLATALLNVKENYSHYQGNKIAPVFTKETFAKSFFDNIINL